MNWNVVLMVVGFALMLAGSLRAFPPKQEIHLTVAPESTVEIKDDAGQWRRYIAQDPSGFRIQVIDGPGGSVLGETATPSTVGHAP